LYIIITYKRVCLFPDLKTLLYITFDSSVIKPGIREALFLAKSAQKEARRSTS